MTEEDEEFEALEKRLNMSKRDIAADIAEGMKEVPRIRNCKHRWEESNFGKAHWAPGTWQYTCNRCGAIKMIRMEQT